MKEKVYFSIDLKSFFASCECVKLGLDPFKSSLVVANKHQGSGAITLAISPYLKTLGVKSRCRLYEIPNHISYTIVNPNMDLYKNFSKQVVNVYLKFVDSNDLHVYSIDECFLDVTNYFSLYKKSEMELAKDILDAVFKETGLSGACGIGSSIFLAKVAMDQEAKKNKSGIAYWKNSDIETKLWNINKLSNVWGIGPSLEKKLSALSIFSGYDLAHANKSELKNKLGSVGADLWDSFNGFYKNDIEFFNQKPKDKSYSHSNYLLKDYNVNDCLPIILKMCDTLENRLQKDNKTFETINVKLIYSNMSIALNKTVKLLYPTSDAKIIYETFINLINEEKITHPIRKIDIHLLKISEKKFMQLNLFEDVADDKINNTVFNIKEKYGYESIIKAANLIDDNK